MLRIADLEDGTFTAQTAVEATPTGWWYGSRLPGARIVTALITERSAAAALLKDSGRRWHEELAATTLLGPLLDRVRVRDEPLRCRPVTVSVLDRLVGPGWLAVGDAASERDPITGCGIHDALLDAADAAWTIAAAVGERESPPWRYEDRVRSRFDSHRRTRDALYASEQRWPTEPFWRGRVPVSAGRPGSPPADPRSEVQTESTCSEWALNEAATAGRLYGERWSDGRPDSSRRSTR